MVRVFSRPPRTSPGGEPSFRKPSRKPFGYPDVHPETHDVSVLPVGSSPTDAALSQEGMRWLALIVLLSSGEDGLRARGKFHRDVFFW